MKYFAYMVWMRPSVWATCRRTIRRTSSAEGSDVSPGLEAARGLRAPARVMLTNWCSPSGMNKRTRSVVPSRTDSTTASKMSIVSSGVVEIKAVFVYHPIVSPSTH